MKSKSPNLIQKLMLFSVQESNDTCPDFSVNNLSTKERGHSWSRNTRDWVLAVL